MLSPALDLGKHMQSEGFLTPGVDMFVGEWGDSDRQVLLLDAPGIRSELQETYEQPSVQILVRGAHSEAYIDVYVWAKTVYDWVIALPTPCALNGTCYVGFTAEIPPNNLGQDQRNRFNITMQFSTIRNLN